MGKWANCTFPNGFEERHEELKHLGDKQIDELWVKYGSLSLGDFANMSWYWSSVNGWACVDNCDGKNAPAMLKVLCNYRDYLNDEKRIVFEKICIILAVEFHAPREAVVESANAEDAVKETLSSLDIVDVQYYNNPSDAGFIKDYAKFHNLCRDFAVSYELCFDESVSLWCIKINSDSSREIYSTGNGSLSSTMQDAFSHINSL